MRELRAINCRGKLFKLDVPVVMGIVNVTPDSFFEGSRFQQKDTLLKRIGEIREEGGQIIDVGGYSTRPGAGDVSEQEELDRVCAAVEIIRSVDKETPISVDTFRKAVALESIGNCGADIINDISGGQFGNDILEAAGELKVPYILMHTVGHTVQEMQQKVEYKNITKDIFRYFAERISKLRELGVNDVIIDPGFGFAKDTVHSFELMAKMRLLKQLGAPMLVGISRKRMVWQTLGSSANEALNGTTALNMAALMNGADILRVHDVKEAAETVKLFCEIKQHAQLND